MAQDSEKRFHSIMDKLFHSAQSTTDSNSASPLSTSPSGSGVQLSRGKKRPYSSALLIGEPRSRSDVTEVFQQHSSAPAGSTDAPICRPWDRGDLLRRLNTFKSMTWFGKPKVVSAVNCARRGWINVDMDIISCESCGARLLFSTPSSWNQQQVEKAALVFSLKLDNGHKLLCPWIDNACDEALAEFAPTPPPILVNKFRERCAMLINLSALPVISSSLIKRMNSPLKQFLEEFGDESLNKPEIDYLENECNSDTAKVYDQALNLISLFGWEPRSLPYVVDCKTESNQSNKVSEILDSSRAVVNLHSSSTTNETINRNGNAEISSELHSHPTSVVLDCKLCGASVGLWTYRSVSRPVEIIRLVGTTELTGERNLGSKNSINHAGFTFDNVEASSKEGTPVLSSIAGGPTPARQNFKATITLPVIGQNLRARLFNDVEFDNSMYDDQEKVQTNPLDKNCLQDSVNTTEITPAEPEDKMAVQNKTIDHGCDTTNDDQTPSLAGSTVAEQKTMSESCPDDSVKETLVDTTGNVQGQGNKMMENTDNSVQLDSSYNEGELGPNNEAGELDLGLSSIENSSATLKVDAEIRSCEVIENDLSYVVSDSYCSQQVSENDMAHNKEASLANLPVSPHNSSHLEVDLDTIISSKEPTDGKLSHDNRTTSRNQECEGGFIKAKMLANVNSELITHGEENYMKNAPLDKIEFDPVRQHRIFCPWIATGNVAPGWKQTLTALQRQKGSSLHSPKNSPSGSLIKVDDPVKSVRNLFTSSAKKLKSSLASNENTRG